jgi:hypothetical protein
VTHSTLVARSVVLALAVCGLGLGPASTGGTGAVVQGARAKRPIRVFLMGGQSNMAGADAVIAGTGLKDLAATGEQTESDRKTLFTWGGPFSEEGEGYYAWGDVRGHVGTFEGKVGFFVHGPEVGFERALFAAGTKNLALIKVANNFTAYENGRSPWIKPNSFYTAWRAFVLRRLAELEAKGYAPAVAGFLWFQGIDDAIRSRDQASYEADLRQLIADLRSDYGSARTPFILARSVQSPIAGPERMRPVRTGQVAVAAADPMADWVDVDDLGPYVRRHHLTAAAQLRVGERMARAYLFLTDPKRPAGKKLSDR